MYTHMYSYIPWIFSDRLLSSGAIVCTCIIACVPSKIQIKDKNSNTISILSVGMVCGMVARLETANVTIISYKPLSDLNVARCQVHALFSVGVYKPLM